MAMGRSVSFSKKTGSGFDPGLPSSRASVEEKLQPGRCQFVAPVIDGKTSAADPPGAQLGGEKRGPAVRAPSHAAWAKQEPRPSGSAAAGGRRHQASITTCRQAFAAQAPVQPRATTRTPHEAPRNQPTASRPHHPNLRTPPAKRVLSTTEREGSSYAH